MFLVADLNRDQRQDTEIQRSPTPSVGSSAA